MLAVVLSVAARSDRFAELSNIGAPIDPSAYYAYQIDPRYPQPRWTPEPGYRTRAWIVNRGRADMIARLDAMGQHEYGGGGGEGFLEMDLQNVDEGPEIKSRLLWGPRGIDGDTRCAVLVQEQIGIGATWARITAPFHRAFPNWGRPKTPVY